jgi:hypothetical protein
MQPAYVLDDVSGGPQAASGHEVGALSSSQ